MKMRNKTVGLALAAAVMIPMGSQLAPAQQATLANPPTPAPSADLKKVPKHIVHIAMVVFEVNENQSDRFRAKLKEYFPDSGNTPFSANLGKMESDERDKLVRAVAEGGFGQVLSRPTVLTHDGTNAKIQIGQVVARPPSDDPNAKDSAEIGLTIDCTPRVNKDGQTLHLELRVARSELDPGRSVTVKGLNYPGIKERYLSTALRAKSGSTIGLVGPGGNAVMVVLLTPTVNPSEQVLHPPKPLPRAAAAVRSTATRPSSGLAGDLQRLKEAMASAAPEAATHIELKGREFQVETVVQSPAEVSGVARALDSFDSVEIQSMRVSPDNGGTRVEAVGVIKQASHVAVPQSLVPQSEPTPHDARFSKLQSLLKELYPEEDIHPQMLNTSVLLRGGVSEKAMPTIVRIAEDFAPNVINDLVVVDQPVRHPRVVAVRPAPSTNLGAEVRQLRADVKAMRTDVQRVIELLQSEKRLQNRPAKHGTDAAWREFNGQFDITKVVRPIDDAPQQEIRPLQD